MRELSLADVRRERPDPALEPREAARRAWPVVVDLIRTEIRRLILAGATDVQLDVPQIAMGLADGGWETAAAVDIIAAIFAGFTAIRRSVHLCYGDFGARSWVTNRALSPLIPTIQALGGGIVDRVVLELSLPEQRAERHLLSETPPQFTHHDRRPIGRDDQIVDGRLPVHDFAILSERIRAVSRRRSPHTA